MTPLSRESAELLAVEALAWLAGNDDLLPVFLGSSGADKQDIRDRARDPEFLASVLDVRLMHDAWITGFCDEAQYAYDFPVRARAALPGGAEVNWT